MIFNRYDEITLCRNNETINDKPYKTAIDIMIRLNCFFQAKRGKYNEALEAAILLTAKTQKHEGMISYDVFESATRKDIFMFCETWESEEALAKHSATPEFKELVGIIQSCGEMKIEQLTL